MLDCDHLDRQPADMLRRLCCTSFEPCNIYPKDTSSAHPRHQIRAISSDIVWPDLDQQIPNSAGDIAIRAAAVLWRDPGCPAGPVRMHPLLCRTPFAVHRRVRSGTRYRPP